MYFYPGKRKTFTRTFNRVRAEVFASAQLTLPGMEIAIVEKSPRVPPPYNSRGTRNTSVTSRDFTA